MVEYVQALYVALLVGICGTAVVGLTRRNLPAVVNAAASLLAALLPVALEVAARTWAGTAVAVPPALSTWVAAAGFLHCVGMLGWYDSVQWWDHLTHTLSAALVAALLYAGLLTLDEHAAAFRLSAAALGALTVAFTLAVGVFWEFVELAAREVGERHDVPPVLEHYGLRDTLLDLAFDAVGALLVVALDARVFVAITDRAPDLVESLLVATAVIVFVGTIGIGVLLGALPGTGRERT